MDIKFEFYYNGDGNLNGHGYVNLHFDVFLCDEDEVKYETP